MPNWDWWLKTDAGLFTRIVIGCGIFAALAGADFIRNGRKATRWREYTFLIFAVALAMAYGAINDAIASRVSWEYFYYGKGLADRLGAHTPPDPSALRSAAIGVGLRATWSAGLIAGVALLIANNPHRTRVRLGYKSLFSCLLFVLACAGICAIAGALAGRAGLLTSTNPDIAAIARENLFRPRQFMTAYGMNLGGYAGGLLGTGCAVTWITRRRRLIATPAPEPAND